MARLVLEVGGITQETAQRLAQHFECHLGRTYNGFSFEFANLRNPAKSVTGTLFLNELNFYPEAKYLGHSVIP